MWRVVGALGSLIFALPLVGLWRDPAFLRLPAGLLALTAAVTLVRPAAGLLILAGLLPVAPALGALAGMPAVAEPLLLAFLAAACLQSATARRAPASQLSHPAVLLGATLVAWAAVAISARQLWSGDSPGVLVRALTGFVARSYFSGEQFGVVREVLPWIEAIALAVVAERIVRATPDASRGLIRMFVFAGAMLSASSAIRLAEISLRRESPLAAALVFLRGVRLNAFFADINAAGSLYALFCVAAVWLLWRRSRFWLVPAGLLVLAVWLAGSRAAFGGVLGGLGLLWVSTYRPRLVTVVGALAAGVAALALVAGLSSRNASLSRASGFRVDMTRAAFALAAERPVFGIGLNNFKPASIGKLPPDFGERYRWAARGENAHNNFLQILVELGLVGLLGFVWLVGTPFRSAMSRGWAVASAAPEATALSGGMAGFLLSAALGHPLLDPHIRALFFLAVGLLAGVAVPPPSGSRIRAALVALMLLLTAVTLPFRMSAERAAEPIAGWVRGASEPQDRLDGTTYRIADATSTWFVESATRTVALPLRARDTDAGTCQVSVAIDGRPGDRVTVSDTAWDTKTIQLPPASRPQSWRRVDLVVQTAPCTLLVGELTQR